MPDEAFDLSAFMNEFREESQELIATITEGLLRLEQTPGDSDTLREIARAVHTLKGNARLMGLDRINAITHRLENLLVSVRDGQLEFSPEMADLILDALDQVTTAANNACETGEEGVEVDELCQRIDQFAQRSAAPAPETETEAQATPADKPTTGPEQPTEPKAAPEQDQAPAQAAEPATRKRGRTRKSKAKSTTTRAEQKKTKADSKKAKKDAEAETGRTRSAKKATRKQAAQPKDQTAPSAPSTAAEVEAKPAGTAVSSRRAVAAETIRVDTSKLDSLANVAGEMVLNLIKFESKADWVRRIVAIAKQHSRTWQQLRDQLIAILRFSSGPQVGADDHAELRQIINRCDNLAGSLLTELETLSQEFNEEVIRVGTTTRMIEEDVLSIRMHPVSTLFNTYPRSVRDLARQLGKPVELAIEGGETELDRKILEVIRDPLMHMVRNAVHHGIEPPDERERLGKPAKGLVRLSAWQQGDQVFIQIADDGRGIDPEKLRQAAVAKGLLTSDMAETLSRDECLRLIFEPGFSTASAVTDISGRGVGMDVVKACVEEMHGEVRVESEVGIGTAITLVLPLTLAISRAILVKTLEQIFAIPTASIELTVKVTPEEIKSIEGREAIIVRNATVPILPLSQVLLIDQKVDRANGEALHILVVSYAEQRVGFIVDELIGEQEIVVKPLGAPLKKVKNIAGAATLGSGQVVIVLSVPDIVASARGLSGKPTAVRPASTPARKRILVVEDSLTARELERSMLEAAGYDVRTAVDGVDGLNKLGQHSFDLIVTDIQMPRMDGFAMLGRLKTDDRYRNIPVIIVTTRADESDRKRGLELGADAYLVKGSLNDDTLIECTRRLIG